MTLYMMQAKYTRGRTCIRRIHISGPPRNLRPTASGSATGAHRRAAHAQRSELNAGSPIIMTMSRMVILVGVVWAALWGCGTRALWYEDRSSFTQSS